MANYYRIGTSGELFNLACEAGLPTIEFLEDRIDDRIVWELAMPADPNDPYNDRGAGEVFVIVVPYDGGFEVQFGDRVLQVGASRVELQRALQWLAGVRPRAIEGGTSPLLVA